MGFAARDFGRRNWGWQSKFAMVGRHRQLGKAHSLPRTKIRQRILVARNELVYRNLEARVFMRGQFFGQ
jgi:hypothetical protein